MTNKKYLVFLFLLLSAGGFAQGIASKASSALIKRVIPKHAEQFVLEEIPAQTSAKDRFEIESRNGKIVLRAANGTAFASALYYYLTEYAHCQVTWNGTNLNLPKVLPLVKEKIIKDTPYDYRYYLNYCTFNYSMSWWSWERWEKEIDWMAMHGINMPLAITGQEYTWYKVYKEMGLSDKDLSEFFSGPAFFGWFYMGNLDAWGGPLPMSWIENHKDLQVKILARERELGMKPVLPAFTGHVPAAFKQKFPSAKLKTANWNNGFADTYILDADDPMYAEVGRQFLKTQTKIYGTDHLYSADTFNENEPPTDDPAYLSKLSKGIYDNMKQVDTAAIWVMQGWLFYSDKKFWKTPQIEALLKDVPNDKMIILDLATEIEPVWKTTDAFYGKQWIWNMLHNFGGNLSLFGRIDGVAKNPALALNDPKSGNLRGIGLTMEAIEQTPVLYELMTAHTWRNTPIELKEWMPDYLRNRYGKANVKASEAWNILNTTVFNGKAIRDGAESIIVGRPTLDSATVWTKTKLNYNRKDLVPAWKLMVEASTDLKSSDGFQYDLIDVSRQVLANYAQPLQQLWVADYKKKDLKNFRKNSKAYLTLISDLDTLLATRKDFLLGPWIADAREWGTTAKEKALYEMNARDLVTLWGDKNSPLHEYSNRQWSGLLNDFYRVRWEKYFAMLDKALVAGKEPDFAAFEAQIKDWEWKWVNTETGFPVNPTGDPVRIAKKYFDKYHIRMTNTYK